jgi:flagellin-like protein
MNRRAISPLIATVLLLAFAVALGTMVVSYILEATHSTPCDDVAIGVDGTGACYQNNRVSFVVVNRGQTPLVAVKVRALNANDNIYEEQLATALGPASAAKVDFPYSTINPASVTLTLVPIVKSGETDVFCTQQEAKVPLRAC